MITNFKLKPYLPSLSFFFANFDPLFGSFEVSYGGCKFWEIFCKISPNFLDLIRYPHAQSGEPSGNQWTGLIVGDDFVPATLSFSMVISVLLQIWPHIHSIFSGFTIRNFVGVGSVNYLHLSVCLSFIFSQHAGPCDLIPSI